MSFFKSMLALLIIIFVPLNSYAIQKCITDGVVTELRIGSHDQHWNECPDSGACIYFKYSEDNKVKSHYVYYLTNLNDNGKGSAMYDMLKASLLTGAKINAWSNLGHCDIENGKSIDALGLSN
ncbi:hypothetical protein [Candidatus Hamiltonella endosymbiont of Tuberolachnus salignus]|uniref:hypothetical protein n=1 Tax=Candidatus Williamhamiltonella endosymbiont of Tuberolachnus salignus TaxID=3077954 RepID=UPI0030D1A944